MRAMVHRALGLYREYRRDWWTTGFIPQNSAGAHYVSFGRWDGPIPEDPKQGFENLTNGENSRLRRAIRRLPDPGEDEKRAGRLTRFVNRALHQRPPPPLPLVEPIALEAVLQPKPDLVKKLVKTKKGDSLLGEYMRTLNREVRNE